MKPGLWQISSSMQAGGGEMAHAMAQLKQEMASMAPEERKMMQDMMAKQGVSMGSGGDATTSVKVCMTREMAEHDEIPAQQGDCKQTISPRSGNTMKFAFTCPNPPSSGEGQVSFASSEAYTMKMVVTTAVEGKPEKVNMDASGKWLSADCGAVKPATMPKK
jgi:hypothetical protein